MARAEETPERTQLVQEVLQSELVYPQEKGELQMTLAQRFHKTSEGNLFRMPMLMEYGISDRWQVQMEWDGFIRRSPFGEDASRGTGDLAVGTQYSFMNLRHSNFHLATGFELTLPLADINKELTEGVLEYEPYLVVAKDFPEAKHLHAFSSLGLGLVQRTKRHADVEQDDPAAHELNWNTGVLFPTRHATFVTEFNWSSNRWNHNGREKQVYVSPGVVWSLPGVWEIAVGVPIAMSEGADTSRLVFKVTHELNILGGRD